MKPIFFRLAVIALLPCMLSCESRNNQNKELSDIPLDSLFTDSTYRYLTTTVDFMEYVTVFKKQGVKYEDVVVKPFQYDKTGDRKTMLIRFGMLCTDMAYLKIVGGKNQTPEYYRLLQRYIKDLNLANIFKTDFSRYNAILNQQLTDSLYNKLIDMFRLERALLIDNVRKANDEDFLVYFSLGTETALMYL